MRKKKVLLFATMFAMTSTLHVQASELTPPTYEDAGATKWTMGQPIDWNNMNRGTQGSNGWHCLYTTESNRDGVFDVTLMQEAKWGMTKSMWRFDNKYSFSWNVESSKNDGYWLMDGTGKIYPQAENGGISGAYAWEAPADGTYTITVDYVAGGGYEEIDGTKIFAEDGVTISINTKEGALKKTNAPAVTEKNLTFSSGTLKSSTQLKTGEFFYVIVDPQQSAVYDQAELKITINQDKKDDTSSEDNKDDGNGSDLGKDDNKKDENTSESDKNNNKNDGNNSDSSKDDDKGDNKGENKDNQGKDNNKENETNKNPNTPQLPSMPLGQPNASAPSLNSSLPESKDKNLKKEKEDSLLTLSEEVGDDIDVAEQRESGEAEETSETVGESASVQKRSVSGTIWLLIGLAEVLGAGIILGAVRYYKNL